MIFVKIPSSAYGTFGISFLFCTALESELSVCNRSYPCFASNVSHYIQIYNYPITVAEGSETGNVFTLLNNEIVGSNHTRTMDVGICSVFVLSRLGIDLAMG
jgi:hypothetical protein